MRNGTIDDYNDLPILTAARLGGAIGTERHHRLGRVPVAHSAGIAIDHFSDNSGTLVL